MSDYRRVRLLKDLTNAYGDYALGDVLRLPYEDADSLVRQGYAVYDEGEMETASVQPAERAVTRARQIQPTRRTI